ncbi:Carbonic anhydrase, putative [Theobroma cacao]|uniref:Carbonic anhydrase, putative n=1 Tax=Theobroma cacao TaxID=3641 RepID=A0A061EWG3_THECC|nr:Carbonic anhydrase, putative [Theobroma cacao]
MKNCNNSYWKPAFSFFLLSCLVLSVSACSQSEEGHEFNYDEASGRGPSRWGLLKPEWRNCSDGRMQSPIDIGTVQPRPQLGDLQRNYTSAPAVLENRVVDVAVVWRGNAGNITINGTVYYVVNCHWHSPSEHTFNRTRFALELHLVHQSAQNLTAVVAILYQLGAADPFIARLRPFITTLENVERVPLGPIDPESIGLPGRKYYRYNGSLTTPPCSEGVLWTVFPQIKTVSRSQVEALRNVLPPENRNNSRPTQPLNNRTVLLYDPARMGTFTLKTDD